MDGVSASRPCGGSCDSGCAPETSAPAAAKTLAAARHAARAHAPLPAPGTAEREELLFNAFGLDIEMLFDLSPEEQEARYLERLDAWAADARPPSLNTYRAGFDTGTATGDGNCLFHSLSTVMAQAGCGEVSATALRTSLAEQTRKDLLELNECIGDEARTAKLLESSPCLAVIPGAPDEARQGLTSVQRAFIHALVQPGSWDHLGGDLAPALAARALQLQIEVVPPYARADRRIVFGDPGWPLVRVALERGHYTPILGFSCSAPPARPT